MLFLVFRQFSDHMIDYPTFIFILFLAVSETNTVNCKVGTVCTVVNGNPKLDRFVRFFLECYPSPKFLEKK